MSKKATCGLVVQHANLQWLDACTLNIQAASSSKSLYRRRTSASSPFWDYSVSLLTYTLAAVE